jgi:hypothetical protein
VTRFVLDASVAIKWYLDEEDCLAEERIVVTADRVFVSRARVQGHGTLVAWIGDADFQSAADVN